MGFLKISDEHSEPRRVLLHGVSTEVKSDPGNGLLGLQPTQEEWAAMMKNQEQRKSTKTMAGHIMNWIGREEA